MFIESKIALGSARQFQITGLQPSSNYEVRIQAINARGNGAFTQFAQVTTDKAPEPPKQVIDVKHSIVGAGGNDLQITWKPNPR